MPKSANVCRSHPRSTELTKRFFEEVYNSARCEFRAMPKCAYHLDFENNLQHEYFELFSCKNSFDAVENEPRPVCLMSGAREHGIGIVSGLGLGTSYGIWHHSPDERMEDTIQ